MRGDEEDGETGDARGSADDEQGGGDDPIFVRVPAPDGDDEIALIDVRITGAQLSAGATEIRLRVSRAVIVGAARGGVLLAVTAIAYTTLPGQRGLVLFVALTGAVAVLAGPHLLSGPPRSRNDS